MEEYNHKITVTPASVIIEAITTSGLTETQLFERTGMPPGWWDQLVAGDVSISPAIAAVLHRAFPTRSPLYWQSLQFQYDLFVHALRLQRRNFEMVKTPTVDDIIASTTPEGLQRWFRILYELHQIEQRRAEEFGAALFQIEYACHFPASNQAAVDIARQASQIIHTFDPNPQPIRRIA